MAVLEPKAEGVGERSEPTTPLPPFSPLIKGVRGLSKGDEVVGERSEHKKRFDRNRDELHAIAKEFAEKIKDNPGVAGIVAKPYGAYLHLITLLELDIPGDLEYEVYDAYGEIFDKYDGEVTFEFDPIDCISPETIDEVAYDDASNIIYRKGDSSAKRDNP